MTVPIPGGPNAQGASADRLRDIESLTDAAFSRLDEQALLNALVERVKKVLQADTAAVLLLDEPARQLVATAASGIEEEVRQGAAAPSCGGSWRTAGRLTCCGSLRPSCLRSPLEHG